MAIAKVLKQAVNGHDLAFDAHALRAMESRGITEEEVIQTLEDPDEDDLSVNVPTRKRCRKFFHKRALRIDVVYEEDVTWLVVITALRKGAK